MRRYTLLLFFATVAWSQQTSRPEAQPIVVQVQMPLANPWTHMLELVVPGVIGAALALLGVWLTNRTNERTNAENRLHQLEVEREKAKIAAEGTSRDRRWEFRKDVYTNLIRTISGLIEWEVQDSQYKNRSRPTGFNERFTTLLSDLSTYANLAPLGESNEVLVEVQTALARATDNRHGSLMLTPILHKLRETLQRHARRDLWGSLEASTATTAQESSQSAGA